MISQSFVTKNLSHWGTRRAVTEQNNISNNFYFQHYWSLDNTSTHIAAAKDSPKPRKNQRIFDTRLFGENRPLEETLITMRAGRVTANT